MDRNKLYLWQVRDIDYLDNSTAVVENVVTNEIMLRKFFPRNILPLMQKISQLSNPYLLKIYDAMDDGINCVVLMEYVQGENLDAILQFNPFFAQQNAVRWTEQICSATSSLHNAGIIHRDINPNNVMVDRAGNIRLIDFNISREMKNSQSRDTTIMGTPGYTSPEQFGFQETDERTDVYSIGVLLNVMLTGCLPSAALAQSYFGDIVMKATKISREERFKNPLELSYAVTHKGKERLKSPVAKIICSIPGFRTLKVWKMLIALPFYFLYFYMLIRLIDTYDKYPNLRPQQVSLFIFTIGIPFLFFFDVFNISRIFGNLNPKGKRALMIVLGIIIMIVSVFVTHSPSGIL